ncbi:MAG: VCBS repeat-containing protein, partial [Desulfobacterales bacterium]
MRPKSCGILSFILCVVFAVSLPVSAPAEDELFLVAASLNGDANYMVSNGDGTFSSQHILQLTSNSDITLPYKYSYGNGLGDFDNDGDLDYIMAMGFKTGNIYISENIGTDYQFQKPVYAASWGPGGTFSGDLAVADFDEDGNADVVMALMYSSATMLYLGDGALGFRSYLVPSSAPNSSIGIDAADFNNDGHADFVVAPCSSEKFFVNLGKGDGTFETYVFDTYDGGAVYGVAAADFDGDGHADIAAAYYDYLYIYKGAGDGMTFEFLSGFEFELNRSALDNYDFNGDGNQDLIAADFGSEPTGVAVLLGNGDGTFTFDDIYLGGTSAARNAVAGPPFGSNREPVAVIEPAYLEVMAGEEIVFDGSYSYDDDGNVVSYEWNFGDEATSSGTTTLMGEKDVGPEVHGVKPTHIYYDAGNYTVTLLVKDDKGASDSVQAEVKVTAVPATVRFSPRKLNLKSRDKWIVAIIKLPDGLDAEQIDLGTVSLATGTSAPIPAYQEYKRGFLARLWCKIQHRLNVVSVKFDRQAVIDAIDGPSDNTVLNVRGKVLHNGGRVDFAGSGIIKTYERPDLWTWGLFKKH